MTPKQNEPTDLVIEALTDYCSFVDPVIGQKAITLAKLQSEAVEVLRMIDTHYSGSLDHRFPYVVKAIKLLRAIDEAQK